MVEVAEMGWTRFVAWVRQRPVVAFYLLCYAFSWGLWLAYLGLHWQVLEILAMIGVFGPALACVWTAHLTSPGQRTGRRRSWWLAFAPAWFAATAILAWYNLATAPGMSLVAVVVYAVLAVPPAYVLASAFSTVPGVRQTLSSLVRPTGRWGWYLLALLLPPAIWLLGAWLSRQAGWPLVSYPALAPDALQLAASVTGVFLYTVLYAGGLNEEAGWTGFALPRLQARYSPLVASVIVWFFWVLWHVPLHLAGLYDLSLHVVVGTFFGRFVFTWLYNRSLGGLLTAILFHTSFNVASQFIPLTNIQLLIEAVLALALIAGERMWRKLPERGVG
jgi:membrane protease YdiL (CAAX protease family)